MIEIKNKSGKVLIMEVTVKFKTTKDQGDLNEK